MLSPESLTDGAGAIRLEGIRGTVDLTGWTMVLDANQMPHLIPETAAVAASAWSALGTGMNQNVNALAIDGSGNLYVGGNFTMAGGASANHVAKWDGTNWSTLGTGMNENVYALVFDGSGNLYAGGYFTEAEGTSANYVARWGEPLPVELSSFSAKTDGQTVELIWQTASETSNAGFERLERGAVGEGESESWKTIAFVD